MATAVAGALVLGVLSAAYDAIWAAWIPEHRAIYGLVHGMTLLSAIGVTLGWRAGRIGRGAIGGATAGLAAAATFYALAPLLGMRAMFAAWMFLWLLFSMLDRHLRGLPIAAAETWGRGLGAAVVSGAAFWSISGIWLEPRTETPNYAWNAARWAYAFFPGFAALLVGSRSGSRRHASSGAEARGGRQPSRPAAPLAGRSDAGGRRS